MLKPNHAANEYFVEAIFLRISIARSHIILKNEFLSYSKVENMPKVLIVEDDLVFAKLYEQKVKKKSQMKLMLFMLRMVMQH